MNFYKLEIIQYDNIDNVITSIYDQKLSLMMYFFKKTNHEKVFNIFDSYLFNKIDKLKSKTKVKLINTQIDKKNKLSSDTEYKLNCYFQTIIKNIQYIDPFWFDQDYTSDFKVIETELNLFDTSKVNIYHKFCDKRIIEATFIKEKNSVILKRDLKYQTLNRMNIFL